MRITKQPGLTIYDVNGVRLALFGYHAGMPKFFCTLTPQGLTPNLRAQRKSGLWISILGRSAAIYSTRRLPRLSHVLPYILLGLGTILLLLIIWMAMLPEGGY